MKPIRTMLAVFFAICLLVSGSTAQAQVFEARLADSDPQSANAVGTAVAVSGDTVLIGQPFSPGICFD